MPKGIARKLIVYITVMVIVVEGGFALLNYNSQERQLLDEVTLSAELVSQTMVSTTWHAMLEDRRESVYQMMENVGNQASVDKVRIFNKAGRIMFSSDTDEGRIVDISAEACDLCHAKDQPLVHVDVPSRTRVYHTSRGERVIGMVTPIYNEPSCSNAACHAHPENINVLGVIDVTMPLERVDAELADLRFRSVLLSAVSVFVLAFFVILFARRFVQQPVGKLIEATKSVGTPELDRPLDIAADDELGDLARSFQSMQDRISASNQQIREFTETLERKVEERTQQLQRTEQKLIQSDRLASLGQLSASVAHEINNPLGGVINFSKLMQRIIADGEIPPGRMDDFREYLGHVVTETVRCGNIVRDLLVFARHSTPSHERHDFNEIIRRTLSVIHHRLELGEVTPELDLAEGMPEIMCDASQVQQIVTNLVLNAAEAMEDGVVTVRTRLIAPRGVVLLEVGDTGTGIPLDNLAKIYDPFFSTKEEGQGTGLGLAVVYGIVEAHGGQIDVYSRERQGTTFTITMPIDTPEVTIESPAPDESGE
jgi:two-component system, NtrC family, sensor kinase